MQVVDFHSHFFSRPFFEALAQASPQEGSVEQKLDRLVERTGLELPDPNVATHLARWTADLDRAGVEHLVSFASLPPEVPALAEAARLANGRLTPMALVDPHADDAPRKVESLVTEGGFGGVLLFPAMHHFHPGDTAARAVFEVLDRHAKVAYVHCGLLVVKLRDLLGLPRPYDLAYANPLGVVPAANAFPRARFVIPHFGAGFLRETLMAGVQCENIHVDTSSSNGWTRTQPHGPLALELPEVFERALDVFGHERILFGTDSGTFPAGWRADRRDQQAELLEDLGLAEGEREAIFAGNARRLLGLGVPA